MALKDIFKIKKRPESVVGETNTLDDIVVISGEFYKAKGTRDAGYCGGSPQALLPQLQATYMKLTRYIQQDDIKQGERKNKTRQEISGLEADRHDIENKLVEEKEKLKLEESKIEKIIKEIHDIKVNPKLILGDSFGKASFWIGFVIILFLTVYLFVFYSSASFSAFFKNFTTDDTNVAQAIFDAQAISKAFADGVTELIFILAIPAVFLGLGYLIHKFSEEKGFAKYLKIFGLMAVTFVFDFIIAYEIVEKIYDIKQGGSFEVMPDMTITMAVQQVNFWLIIFAGFIVYIIWGLVFNFTMSEYEKMDKVRYAIKSKEQKLSEYKDECKTIKEKISTLQSAYTNLQGKINKLKIELESYVLYFNDVREGINNYFTGWIGFLKATATSQNLIHECTQIKDNFLQNLRNSEFIRDENDQLN